MFPIHRAWALALQPMMSAEPQDFEAWAEELDQEYDRYITCCQQNGYTPASKEVILWEARQEGKQPSDLLRARQALRRP